MNIVYSSNDNYARHLAASMISVMENNRGEEKIDFYILNVGLSVENIEKLKIIADRYNRNFYNINLENIKDRFNNADVPIGSFAIEMYSRFFLAEALPESEHRALWVDCDTSVVGSIHDAYYCDMKNKAIAAVIDQPNFGLNILCEDASIPKGLYYNSGIILADLDVWRRENISKQFIQYLLERLSSLSFPDQSIINHVLHNQIYTLPLKYNLVTPSLFLSYKKMVEKWNGELYSRKEYNAAKKNPVIIHYTNFRPWKRWCLHPLKKYYRKYLKLTPYAGTPLENDGLLKMFRGLFASVTAKLKSLIS